MAARADLDACLCSVLRPPPRATPHLPHQVGSPVEDGTGGPVQHEPESSAASSAASSERASGEHVPRPVPPPPQPAMTSSSSATPSTVGSAGSPAVLATPVTLPRGGLTVRAQAHQPPSTGTRFPCCRIHTIHTIHTILPCTRSCHAHDPARVGRVVLRTSSSSSPTGHSHAGGTAAGCACWFGPGRLGPRFILRILRRCAASSCSMTMDCTSSCSSSCSSPRTYSQPTSCWCA